MADGRDAYDVLVVGGGPAGIGAACAAAESGRRVGLIDESPWPGGQIWRGEGAASHSVTARKWLERLASSGTVVRGGCSVVGTDGSGRLVVESQQESMVVRFESLVLATGARERFLPFPGWTAPHVVGVGGLQTLVKSGWPIAGRRVLIAGSGPLLLAVADGAAAAGATVVAVAEQAEWERVRAFGLGLWRYPAKLAQGLAIRTRLASVPYLCGWWPERTAAVGTGAVVTLTNGHSRREWSCDVLACGFGLTPNLELARLVGCRIARDEHGLGVEVGPDQETSVEGIYAAGEATGIKGADGALVEGRLAGYAAAGLGAKAEALRVERDRWVVFGRRLRSSFEPRPELRELADDETIVCRCEDVTLGRLRGLGSAREAKLMTRCGMGPCQGRVCGGATSFLFGWDADTLRPPITAARVESLMALDMGDER